MRKALPPVEQALKDRALDIANEGFTIADLRQPHAPLIYVNEGFERLTGYSSDEVLGSNCRFLQGPETDAAAREEIRAALRERRECRVEILNYRKDGTPFWNRLSLTPVRDRGGTTTHYIGVQSDVSARREAEDALRRANDELRVANEKRRRSLEAAAHIQRSLLPHALPDVPGLRFAWGFRPCDELAGDLLGIVPLDADCVGLYVIDVAGHGVPAALLSVTLSHWLAPARGQSPLVMPTPGNPHGGSSPPARVAQRLSAQFPFDERTAQYFTMLYGVLDARRRTFRFVCAGHPAPLYQPCRAAPRFLSASGFPVGLFPEAEYEEEELALGPGDRLFVFSDGLAEAHSAAGQELGQLALLEALASTRTLSLDDAVQSALRMVEDHVGEAGMKDDLTLLGVEAL